jgi:hypothetical protein
MALSTMTELEAVNFMLATIGESPVSSLNESGNVDAVMAFQALNRVSREVQSKGWHFNTESDLKLTPTFPSNEIRLPSNCVQVDTVGVDKAIDVAQRGLVLYNRIDKTTVFSKSLLVDMVLLLDWDLLPQAAREYIAIRAARSFQTRSVGGTESFQLTSMEEVEALTNLKKFDGRTRDTNFLSGSESVARILRRRTVLR